MRRVLALLVLGLWLGAPAPGRAQATPVRLDEVVARINDGIRDDIIQSLEVRRARVLKLFGPEVTTDPDVLDRLIIRRLEIADSAGFTVPDPTPADVSARRAHWEGTLVPAGAAPVNLPALLAEAGMPDATLTAWFRDDARIEAVESQRFAAAPAGRDEVTAYIRAHPDTFQQPDGRPMTPDDPAAQAKARDLLATAKRAAAIASWVDTLRKRATVTIVK